MKTLHLVIIVTVLGVMTSMVLIPAFAESWQSYVVSVGSSGNPALPAHNSTILYRIMNGTGIFQLHNYEFTANVSSRINGTFEINILRDFPYFNGKDGPGNAETYVVIENGVQLTSDKYTKNISDCFFTYSIPFRINSTIVVLSSDALYLMTPIYGDRVSDSCMSGKAFAGDENSWHSVYQLGKFNDPKKADQIFISSYKITNGTVTELEPGAGAFYARIHSSTNATLYYKVPRNFPYTNSIGSFRTSPPSVMMDVPPIGSPQRDFVNSTIIHLTNQTDDCFFTFPLQFSGDHTVQFSFEYLLSGGLQSYGDDVPQYCTNQTIAQHLSPLKQITLGLDPKYVKCDSGLYTILHPDKNTISCVKPKTGEKLVARGWTKAISWYSDEQDAKINPLGVLALIIYSPPDACLGLVSPSNMTVHGCSPNTFYLKINSAMTAYLMGYNICDEDSCTSANNLSVLLPIKDALRPNFQMIGLPEDLHWKYGDTVKIQLYVSSNGDKSTMSLLDLGNSTIVP